MMNSSLKFNWLMLLAICLFVSSCGDDSEEEDQLQQMVTEDLGNDFQPLTTGSWWEYAYVSTQGNFSIRTTVLEETKEFNGISMKKVETVRLDNETSDFVFMGCDDIDCFLHGETHPTLGDNYLYSILKHDSPVGTEWSYEYDYQGAPNRHEYSIEEKGVTRIVEGETFTDVTVVKRDFSAYSPLTDWIYYGQDRVYFAKGIGSIEVLGNIGANNTLTDYEIK